MSCISSITVAFKSPGVIIIVDTGAVVAAVVKPIGQLVLVATALAPTPFTLKTESAIILWRLLLDMEEKLTGIIAPSESTSVAHHLFKVSTLKQDITKAIERERVVVEAKMNRPSGTAKMCQVSSLASTFVHC